mgnify:CR=1 FL=1
MMTPRRAATTASRAALGIRIATAVALLGLCLVLLPAFLSWSSGREHAEALSRNTRAIERASDDELSSRLEAARVSNATIAEILARDPYGPGSTAASSSLNPLLLPGSDVMARLIVPVIDVDLPVFPGVDESALGRGAGWLPGTSLPVGGARTRSVIAGHSGRLEADYLTRLDELAQGDIFLVEVLGETLAYRVTDTRAVDPRDLTALRLEDDRDLVTLVTCTPRGENTHRLLVTGERIAPSSSRRCTRGVTCESWPWTCSPRRAGSRRRSLVSSHG